MKRINVIAILILVCLAFGELTAQSSHRFLREGDKAYDKDDYLSAEMAYRMAREKENADKSEYNLGNSIYMQGDRMEEAIEQFQSTAENAESDDVRALAYHNLGNAYFEGQQYDQSVKSFIEALKLNPDDMDTKKNLTAALQQLKIQQQQQQQQQQQDQQEQNEEDQQEQQQQEEENQDQQQQQQQQQQEEEQEQQQEEQPQDLSKKEAEELLKIIESEDQKVQEKLRKASAKDKKMKKDW